MQRSSIWVLSFIILMTFTGVAYGCSSFVVYSNKTFYGMNLDYTPVELKFVLRSGEGGRQVFAQYMDISGYWRYVNGMNNHGVFSNYQMAYARDYRDSGLEPTVPIFQVVECLGEVDNLQDIQKIYANKRIVPNQGFALHSLVAEPSENCMIVEVLTEGNSIIKNENNFMVMTNFYNSDHLGESYEEIVAIGAARYKSIYQGILDHLGQFDVDTCFEILQTALQSSTLSTLVFDPEKQEVFVVLARDFQHIYKVSLGDKTIETYKGFQTYKQVKLDADGILASELKSWR